MKKENTTVINRINRIMEYLSENNNSFADRIGVDRSNLSKMLKGQRTIGEAIINKIVLTTPFRKEWLQDGIGDPLISEDEYHDKKGNSNKADTSGRDMLNPLPTQPTREFNRGEVITDEEKYKEALTNGFPLLPEVDFKFAAGQTTLINNNDNINRYWYLPDCKDCEGIAQVVGNSMSPALPSGCWVALKRHFFSRERANQIPFGNVFGIVVEDPDTGDYHGYIKILRRYRKQELSRKYWIAHSINESEFDDFDIDINQVRGLWIVKQHIVSDTLL